MTFLQLVFGLHATRHVALQISFTFTVKLDGGGCDFFCVTFYNYRFVWERFSGRFMFFFITFIMLIIVSAKTLTKVFLTSLKYVM